MTTKGLGYPPSDAEVEAQVCGFLSFPTVQK
jgi:hypothetical protein